MIRNKHMKSIAVVAVSIVFGFIIGVASFKDGFDKQAYSLKWDWGMGENISRDCLFFRKRVSEHTTESTPLFCVKNSFKQ